MRPSTLAVAEGGHLVACITGTRAKLTYWRDRNREVDFVLKQGERLTAIEVKTSTRKVSLPGMAAFVRAHGECVKVLVGGQGISLEEFLMQDPLNG